MNNKEIILNALNIKINQAFNILDNKYKSIGTYVIITNNDRIELRYYNSKTKKWLKKADTILGLLIVSLINGDNYIKTLNENISL